MSIAPVVTSVSVKASPARAFTLFTQHISQWWQGRGECIIGKNPWVEIVMEQRAGGRLFERDAQGNETGWGTVLVYEPPHRLLIGWHLTSSWKFDPEFETEVDVTFIANKAGGTDVRLEHRNLERFGTEAEKTATSLGGGWPKHIGAFGVFVDQETD